MTDGVQRGLVGAPGRDPCGLVRREQVRAVGRLHFDRAVDGILDLVEVVVVPAGRQPLSLVDQAAARRVAAVAQVDPVAEAAADGRPIEHDD